MTLQEKLNPFLNDMQSCIEKGQYYAALTVALTLPDICASLDKNSFGNPPGERYEKWMNQYFIHQNNYDQSLNAKDFYKLRCAYIHAGTDNISKESNPILSRVRFTYGSNAIHRVGIQYSTENIFVLYLPCFCQEMRNSVIDFIGDSNNNKTILNNSDKITLLINTDKPFSL
ncbi:hypothetical protein EFM21_00440 [Leuconostoc falkenbergense]|uniref:hypothetical protein n=1 Tax=Leuconostoc falkenbergense TaxID=2766470 RepID=UPI0021AA54DB|nr:hypothetical protein [Leuconostoc falkenbergense]MCT4377647.1 hypothetical protein [Leuconostoc falkenbergense]